MKVDYISHMGDDLTVVNAARVSFNKHREEFKDDDKRLLAYLASHGHWTPFSHPQITVRVKAPIFVARQLFKHKVGMTENEVSRRYVDDEPEFFLPDTWRGRPTNGAKQGSSHEVIETFELFHWDRSISYSDVNLSLEVSDFFERTKSLYTDMLKAGVAPEQARMILPQAMYTSWYWTGSLAAFARICNLRLDSHAQYETTEVASMIYDIISPLYPESWKALMNEQYT